MHDAPAVIQHVTHKPTHMKMMTLGCWMTQGRDARRMVEGGGDVRLQDTYMCVFKGVALYVVFALFLFLFSVFLARYLAVVVV